jgi:hypothetical protein
MEDRQHVNCAESEGCVAVKARRIGCYLAFAKKAEADGFKQVAKIFRAAAEAETVHAHAHFRVMGGVKSTLENAQTAQAGEGYEFKEMYPKFVAEAQAEGNKAALQSFQFAMAVEKIHHDLYGQAIASLNRRPGFARRGYLRLPSLRHTVVGRSRQMPNMQCAQRQVCCSEIAGRYTRAIMA